MMLDRCPLPEPAAVVEVGCGTGRLLREIPAAVAVGVDAEPAMLQSAGLVAGRAEALPLRGATFDLAFMSLVMHLVGDKPAAARELRRVLRPRGQAAIWTLTPEHVERFYLNRYFPSLPGVDLPRFEPPERWARLLLDAGFATAGLRELVTWRQTTARRLAQAVRGGYISTLPLLPRDEFAAGAAQLEAEAAREPARRIHYRQIWCLIWARAG
jgi:SAM-dependent methyltransferase